MSTSEGKPTQFLSCVISDASSSAYRLVNGDTTDTTNTLISCAVATDATAPIIGVTTRATTAADEHTVIVTDGIAMVDVDGNSNAIDIGDFIIPTTGGQGIIAAAAGATAQYAIGIALAPSAADGDVIPVLISRTRIVKGTE
jgi:hypothetical protein